MCSDQVLMEECVEFTVKRRLNPTLDWICALTRTSSTQSAKKGSLNPTLDWICALTN